MAEATSGGMRWCVCVRVSVAGFEERRRGPQGKGAGSSLGCQPARKGGP